MQDKTSKSNPDPVIEVYKKDFDMTLIDEILKLEEGHAEVCDPWNGLKDAVKPHTPGVGRDEDELERVVAQKKADAKGIILWNPPNQCHPRSIPAFYGRVLFQLLSAGRRALEDDDHRRGRAGEAPEAGLPCPRGRHARLAGDTLPPARRALP